jgi:EAL domain-containing protein (putative c-di-GMP-specific phosphodiesterase class I)
LADAHVVGHEALVRWAHPTRGLLSPGDFLDVAEDTGLIIPIGAWVVTEACRQQGAWQASLGRPLQMAVNLSGRQLLQADLCDHVSAAIDHAAMDPARLTLELTETVFTQASRSFLADLETLKARGVRFALDDFGTGYSSLAYLEQFPVDVVKIGPTFVAGLGITTQDTTLVTAIVNLGHTLHLTVVAEGVETLDQLAALQDMGCDLVQGFHFAVPSPADQIPALLAAIRTTVPRTGQRRRRARR